MEWQAVAKSVIGVKHVKNEKPCQDSSDFSIEDNGRVLLGAVSDGMGSAEHSDIGSELAVKSTIDILKAKKVWNLGAKNDAIKNVFEDLVQNVKHKFVEKSSNLGYSLDDLACTLIAFVATPEWFAAIQIGDGQVVVCLSERDYQLVFKPDKGEYANETTPITSSSALQEMKFCLISNSCKFICAATDGIENISLVKAEGWKPFDKFFDGLMDSIESKDKTLLQKEQEVEDFLNSQKINTHTDDDKTLLLCSYSNFNSSKQKQSGFVKSDINPQIDDENKRILDAYDRFVDDLKIQIGKMIASEGTVPELGKIIKKNKKNKKIESITLEITFVTRSALKGFTHLYERIENIFFDENSLLYPKEIEEVIVYNQDANKSLYYVKAFRLIKKKRFNIQIFSFEVLFIAAILTSVGAVIFFFIITPNINTKAIDPEQKATPNTTKAPSTNSTTVPSPSKSNPPPTKNQKNSNSLPVSNQD